MRKVKITKQQTVNAKAVFMGLTPFQLIAMGIGVLIAIATFTLLFFTWGLNVDITMTIVFIELVVSAGFSVINIDGMNLFKWLKVVFGSPIFRPYQSKGVFDTYEKEQK